MRVIAGEFRSRRLRSVPGVDTRPTPDRLRETLFNILAPRIEGVTFADAYAGTGAVGIEALSRGAKHVFFFERDRAALDAIRGNLADMKIEARATVVKGHVLQKLALYPASIVFIDPPYDLEREYAAAMELLAEKPPALAVAQHSIRFHLKPQYGPLAQTRTLRQGDNALSFYSPGSSGNMMDDRVSE